MNQAEIISEALLRAVSLAQQGETPSVTLERASAYAEWLRRHLSAAPLTGPECYASTQAS